MQKLLVLLLASLLLAGCASNDTTDEPDEPGSPMPQNGGNETMEPQVFSGEGTVQASAGVFALGNGGVEFNVNSTATLVHAEIEWTDASGVQDLNLGLASPSAGDTNGVRNYDYTQNKGSPGNPDNPHSLTVEEPEAGAWSGTAFSNGGGGQVQYRIVVTVFYGETAVPEGYSAL